MDFPSHGNHTKGCPVLDRGQWGKTRFHRQMVVPEPDAGGRDPPQPSDAIRTSGRGGASPPAPQRCHRSERQDRPPAVGALGLPL